MSKKVKNVYQQILEISALAEEMEFEKKRKISDNTNDIKKVINKPKDFNNFTYEAYLKYFSEEKD